MDPDIKIFVKEVKDGIQNSNTEADILKWLTVVKSLLVKETFQNLDFSNKCGYSIEQINLFSKEISDSYIIQLYELLLTKFSVEWVSKVGTEKFNLLVRPVFLQGNYKYSFITLFQASSENTTIDYKCQKCVALLEEYLNRRTLTRLLQSQSLCTAGSLSRGPQTLAPDQEILVGFLTSLPSKMANKLRQENSDAFLPQSYIPLLAASVLDNLDSSHQILSQGENVSLHFISVLIGKLSLTGYANLFVEAVLPHLCVRVRRDYLWCRICERIFLQVPSRCLEAVVVPLFRLIPWYGLVDKFLGDSVLHNTSLKMLLCTKLLLHRTFPEPKTTLHNIIGYLSSFHTRRHLLIEVSLSLLRVWGNASSMRHISAEQHLYISRALVVCMGYLNEKEKSANEG
ncbi:telomere length regulation protein TEL2 homolog, partial [Elysia marginata]